MHPQPQSRLLSLSPELRQAIFSLLVGPELHLAVRQGHLHLCACLVPSPSTADDGYERRTTGDVHSDIVWARRLQSSWGAHWPCEELVLSSASSSARHLNRGRAALMSTCHRAYQDVWNLILATAVIHTADLHALSPLLHGTHNPVNLRRLSVTARIPLNEFAMGRQGSPSRTNWHHACDVLARLHRLVELRLYLDHDDPETSWTAIDERAVLACLPDLEQITVSLPLLHPGAEDPKYHFTDESPTPPGVTIQRRLRQLYYVGGLRYTKMTITRAEDFPFLIRDATYRDLSLEEKIARERAMWKQSVADGNPVTLSRRASLMMYVQPVIPDDDLFAEMERAMDMLRESGEASQ